MRSEQHCVSNYIWVIYIGSFSLSLYFLSLVILFPCMIRATLQTGGQVDVGK